MNQTMYREFSIQLEEHQADCDTLLEIDTPCLAIDFETINVTSKNNPETKDCVVTCAGGAALLSPTSEIISFAIVPKDHWYEKDLIRELITNLNEHADDNVGEIEFSDFERYLTFNGTNWDMDFIKRNYHDKHYWMTSNGDHLDVRESLKRRLINMSVLDEDLSEPEYPSLNEGLRAWGEEPTRIRSPECVSGEFVSGNTPEISKGILNGNASRREKQALKQHAKADCVDTIELWKCMLDRSEPVNTEILRNTKWTRD